MNTDSAILLVIANQQKEIVELSNQRDHLAQLLSELQSIKETTKEGSDE